MKLHIGCGNDIKKDWVNHDIVKLKGVDVVHDLSQYPWPWSDNTFEEIYMKDVLEHLPNTVRVMEELYRISKPGGRVYIAVPYWNSWEAITDPTHISQFNEYTFDFFDSSKRRCQDRPYYTHARFKIKRIGFSMALIPYFNPVISINGKSRSLFGWLPPWRHFVIFNPLFKFVFGVLASYLSNIIIGLEVYLEKES